MRWPASPATPAASSRSRRTSRSTTRRRVACPRTASRRWTCRTSRRCSTAASRSRPPPCAASTRRSARSASIRRRSSRPTDWPRPRCSCRRTPAGRAAEDRLRRPRRAQRPPLRRGLRGLADGRRAGVGGQGRRGRVGRHRRRRIGHRAARRSDRRDLDQRPEHGHRLLGQARGDHRHLPEHPEVAHQSRRTPRARPTTRPGCSTGDYGAFYDGDLYITGRVKDLVIIDGRNHYPQDLEYSAQEASRALRTGFVAAFSVPANQLPDEVFDNAHAGPEARRRRHLGAAGHRRRACRRAPTRWTSTPVADEIRAAIAVRHGVTVRDVLLTPAGRDSADVERQDRSPGLPLGLPRRQSAQREGRQRLPRRRPTDVDPSRAAAE